ncbi:MAG TPA: DUF29 domain-containing protein [Acetobacteraceae bacterium]
MSNLYDTDVVEWSERQAQLLRGMAARQPSNEQPDWENIIEEVESVGQSQVEVVESLLTNVLLHDLKALAWPEARDVPSWEGEARLFRRQARRKLTPSMRGKINVAELFSDAVEGLPTRMYDQAPADLPAAIPNAGPADLDDALADREDPARQV